jgi:hypothetical protein
VRSAPTLSAAAVEDHLDIAVVAEALEQVLVQTAFVAGHEKEMSGHWLVYCPSAPGMAGHFFLAIGDA